MKPRKFHSIQIHRHANVTSTGHYGWEVSYRDTSGNRHHRWYHYGLMKPMEFKAPKYLIAEVERLIAADIENGITVFYEFDRDGNKRYENLRYHDPDYVQRSILPNLKGAS